MKVSHRTKVFISFEQKVKPIYGDLDPHFNKIIECSNDLVSLEAELDGIHDADIYLFNVDDFTCEAFMNTIKCIRDIVGNCEFYIFTNGIILRRACFDSSMNLCLLLHSPSEYQNVKINGYEIEDIHKRIPEMKDFYRLSDISGDHIGKIIVYCGIVKGYMDLSKDAFNMIDFVKNYIGADEIIFFELSTSSEYFRCSRELFEGLPDDPDEDTNICAINGISGIKVKVYLSLDYKHKEDSDCV